MNSGFHQKNHAAEIFFFFSRFCKYRFIKTSLSADSFLSFASRQRNKIIFCAKFVIYWLIKEDKCAEIYFDSSELIIDGMANSSEWKRRSFCVNLQRRDFTNDLGECAVESFKVKWIERLFVKTMSNGGKSE